MSPTRQAILWAGALLAIAVLAVFDIIPEEVAQYSVIALPALATIGIIRPRSCAPVGRCRT